MKITEAVRAGLRRAQAANGAVTGSGGRAAGTAQRADGSDGRAGGNGAVPAAVDRRAGGRAGTDGRPMVPRPSFDSYYGKPVLNPPVWEALDIAGYLFLGGLAGASSLLGAGAQATGRPALARASKLGALGGVGLSLAALVHDLGRPQRFLHMLRVIKPTSPMSVGSWLLAGYAPLAGVAAASAVTGRAPRLGAAATGGAALVGPAVAAYTAVLLSDTAVPTWHEAHRELPYVFVASAATAAGGLGLAAAPLRQSGPARTLGVLGAVAELATIERMRDRLGSLAEPYRTGTAATLMRAGEVLTAAGAAGAVLGRHSRVGTALSGAALLAASAATRFGIFHAGVASARDPRYTVEPQRARRRAVVNAPADGVSGR